MMRSTAAGSSAISGDRPPLPAIRAGREDVFGDRVGGRHDLDAGHEIGLDDDVGAHLAGADQAHAHRLALAVAPVEALGDGAAGAIRGICSHRGLHPSVVPFDRKAPNAGTFVIDP